MFIPKGIYNETKRLHENAVIYNKYRDDLIEINIYRVDKGFRFSLHTTHADTSDVYLILEGVLKQVSNNQNYGAFDTIVLNKEDHCIVFEALEDTVIYNVCQSGRAYAVTTENFDFIEQIMSALQEKDHYTKAHCERVLELARKMVPYMDLTEEETFCFVKAAKYHDVGKIEVSDDILNKPGKLTASEFDFMKNHVLETEKKLLKKYGKKITQIAIEHHERLDGSGYPYGLKGDKISRLGRALAVIDTFDAMTTDRVYKKGKHREEAIKELYDMADVLYDRTFIVLLEDILKAESDGE